MWWHNTSTLAYLLLSFREHSVVQTTIYEALKCSLDLIKQSLCSEILALKYFVKMLLYNLRA